MLEDGIIKVLYSREFEKASYEAMINLIIKLRYQYQPIKLYFDSANPEFIKSVKGQLNENTDYESVIERANRDKIDFEHRMTCIPVSFNQYGAELLNRFRHIVSKKFFSVSSVEHSALVTQMRMARFNDKSNLEKDSITTSNTYDAFDSCRLALSLYKIGGKRR